MSNFIVKIRLTLGTYCITQSITWMKNPRKNLKTTKAMYVLKINMAMPVMPVASSVTAIIGFRPNMSARIPKKMPPTVTPQK